MRKYYAVCNVNGPISRVIYADDVQDATNQFEAADTQSWIDGPATDAEENLEIEGDGMDEDDFAAALTAAGLVMVMDLASVVCGQGPTMRNNHLADGWQLWAEV